MSDSITLDGFVLLDDTVTHDILDSNSDDLFCNSDNTIEIKNNTNINIENDKLINDIIDQKSNVCEDVVECDSTTPISMEKVDLDNEYNEIPTENSTLTSYPITLIDYQLHNTNEIEINVNNQENQIESLYKDNIKINSLNEHDYAGRGELELDEICDKNCLSNVNHLNDVDLDKTDFRVNILDRNDDENKWSTNQYIHMSNEGSKVFQKESLPIENDNEVKNESNMKNTEITRLENEKRRKIEKEENWSTDQYLQEDENEKRFSEKEDKMDDKSQPEDEPDFRVNILERNDRVDAWLTNRDIDKTSVPNKFENEFECDANKLLVDTKLCISDRLVNLMETVSYCPESLIIESDNKSGDNKETNKIVVNQENFISGDELISDVDNSRIDQRNITSVSVGCTAEIIPSPIGILNPSNFPAMIAVISVLFNCSELRLGMINYHHSDEIANFDIESSTDISPEDVPLLNNLSKLFVEMKEHNEEKINEIARFIEKYFRRKEIQLDFFNGFNYFLKIINTITKSVVTENENLIETEDIMFDKFICKNKGFVTDSFSGQIKHKIFCTNCEKVYSEEYEQINSLLLKIPPEKKTLTLEECIYSYFSNVKIEITNDHKCCNDPSIWANKEFTHTPEYLVLCIDRKLENHHRNRTFIETDTGIFLNSKEGMVLYSLRSVIDEMLINNMAINNVKCLFDFWYMIESRRIRKIAEFEVISEYNVGFMFKKLKD